MDFTLYETIGVGSVSLFGILFVLYTIKKNKKHSLDIFDVDNRNERFATRSRSGSRSGSRSRFDFEGGRKRNSTMKLTKKFQRIYSNRF
jgi:hypothetical protein